MEAALSCGRCRFANNPKPLGSNPAKVKVYSKEAEGRGGQVLKIVASPLSSQFKSTLSFTFL